LDLLNELLDNRLIIIAAPAGYGKTSLLVDLATQTSLPFCWYALDPLDRDFKRFVAYIIAAISHKFPEFGPHSSLVLQNLNQPDPDLDQLITTIVNEAYECIHEHFAIVFDDYHFVDDQPDINRFLGRFIQEMDDNCHVVVSSRTLLSLPDLPLMVARSQVGGLGFEELAFQAEEIQNLIQQNYKTAISDMAAAEIAHDTEGWITGLLLSTQSMYQGMSDRLRLARVSSVGLYDYLAQQVLDQQPAAIRSFLLRSSLIEEFDAELCEAVLGPPPIPGDTWSGIMESILRNNLFVLPVGERGQWLRYHHLFRDFLQNRLAKEDPEEEKRIINILADVYTQRGDWERAYLLYQRLNRTQELVDLVEAAGSALLKSGRLSTLASWIDALPPEASVARPILLSLRGSVSVMLGEVERGLSLLTHSQSLLRNENNLPELAITLTRRSHTYRYLGDYDSAIKDADEALSILSGLDSNMRSYQPEALRSRGLSLYRLGRPREAIECLKEAAGVFDSLGNLENVALTQIDLGSIYQNIGEFNQSRFAFEGALVDLNKVGNITRQAIVLNNLGVLYQQLGDYEKSSQCLEQSLKFAEQSGFARAHALALVSIGDLYRVLDAWEAAITAYKRAKEIVQKLNDRFLQIYVIIAEASAYRMSKDLDKANRRILEATELLNGGRSPYENGLLFLEQGRQADYHQKFMDAIENYYKATDFFGSCQQIIEQIQSTFYLSNALLSHGDPKEAITQLKRALNQLETLEDHHILVDTARDIKPVLVFAKENPEISRPIKELIGKVEILEKNLPTFRRKIRRQVSVVPFSAPRLSIRALGKMQVMIDGKPISSPQWQAQVARDMLYLVLAHPDGITRDAIVDIFWPESNKNQINLLFKNTMYRMRRALEQEVVVLEDDHYFFNRALDYEYDVEMFLSKITQAQSNIPLEKKIAAYETAIHYYKGQFSPEIEGTWVLLERERLQQAYQGALLKLVDLHLQSGDHYTALKYCQDILVKDPCLEEAHRLAMRVHAAMGNKADIVRQYERCEQTLLRELNLPPSPQTKNLYQNLIR